MISKYTRNIKLHKFFQRVITWGEGIRSLTFISESNFTLFNGTRLKTALHGRTTSGKAGMSLRTNHVWHQRIMLPGLLNIWEMGRTWNILWSGDWPLTEMKSYFCTALKSEPHRHIIYCHIPAFIQVTGLAF